MNLSDLRKVSVKKHLRIRFSLSNGMECIVNEHGVAQVPALRAVPSFNLEDELAGAQAFIVEPAGEATSKTKRVSQRYTRDEITSLAGASSQPAHDEHED